MTTIQEAENALLDARAALNERRRVTNNTEEEKSLAAEVDRISKALTRLALDDLAAASQRVSEAADGVEAILRTANTNVFDKRIDASLRAVADVAIRLADQASKAFAFDASRALDEPNADSDADVADPAPPSATGSGAAHNPGGQPTPQPPRQPMAQPSPQAASVPDARRTGALPPIVVGRKFGELSDEYRLCWDACAIRRERRSDVERAAERLLRGEQRYRAVSGTTRIPWQLIGLMHGLECGYDFNKHLHNGDSLGAVTVRVPEGRPPGWVAGSPWEKSAVDALELKNLHRVQEWSLPRVLYALEAFNGFGYRGKGIRSPYLWSFSNLYEKGKYTRDHFYDPEAVSQQVGSAVLLKHLEERGLWP